MRIEEINPESLKKVDDQEILSLHHRVHQLAPAVRRDGKHEGLNWEDLVNAHTFLVHEMERRGMNHNPHDELDQAAEELSKNLPKDFLELPEEVMVVPNFVCLVGSAVKEGQKPNDLDVLFRANRNENDYLIQAENVWLPVRNVLGKDKQIHFIDNPQGAHADFVPIYDLVLRRKPSYEIQTVKAGLKPIQHYEVQKPMMAGYTDTFSADQLWEAWGSKQDVPMYISPKVDGFRCILQKAGDKVSIYFEDSKEERSDKLPQLKEALLKAPDCIIEGELQAAQDKKFLARPEVFTFLAGNLEAEPYIFLYDILYFEKDIHENPFSERWPLLEEIGNKLGDHFIVLPQTEVRSKDEFIKTAEKALDWQPWENAHLTIEGVVARRSDMPYVFGPTEDYAKFKLWVELKVKVLKVERTENGYTYECALRDGDKDVSLGKTFVSKDKLADPGDTLNVTVEELILYPDGTVAWGKPYPQGPDKSRPAYTVEQAIDMARRGKCLKEVQEKSLNPEEDDTRGGRAEAFWQASWFRMFPKSGKGRWVYQHHWRGLSGDEAKNLSEEELLKTDHSVHGDLRFEDGDSLWGFTVFLGSTEEVRQAGGDRLDSLAPNDNLQGSFKLEEPKEWLDVGDPPLVVQPEGVGATSQKWAKFFMVDHGTYEVGVWREHMFEVFLHGDKLNGRFIMEYAPIGGKRIWIIDKPEDQTPYAEKHDLNDVIAELKQKGQKYLVWSKPGEKPKLIEVDKVSTEKSWYVPLIKSEEEHFVLGPFLVPDEIDLQGDIVTAEEIEKAVHKFMEDYQKVGEMHQEILPRDKATVVECYVTRGDWEINGQLIKKGTAIIGVKIHDDALWQDVKKGLYTGFSIKGRARTD
jgi:hypothetical protein